VASQCVLSKKKPDIKVVAWRLWLLCNHELRSHDEDGSANHLLISSLGFSFTMLLDILMEMINKIHIN